MCEACTPALRDHGRQCPVTAFAQRLAEFAGKRFSLTLHQVAVIAFMLEDRTIGYTAATLSIRPCTVLYHRQQVFRMTGTHSALQLALLLSTSIHNVN